MKPITEKQIGAIKRLGKATGITLNNIEQMSSFEASQVISDLIEKMKQLRGKRNAGRKAGNDFRSDALAGLAVKILAQRCNVQQIVSSEDKFRKRVVELYRVFSSARQACLA